MIDLELNLTRVQLKWLSQHGDRDESDIKIDDQGLFYVFMQGKNNTRERVYLPQNLPKTVNN